MIPFSLIITFSLSIMIMLFYQIVNPDFCHFSSEREGSALTVEYLPDEELLVL